MRIYFNAKIYTLDSAQPHASGIVIDQDHILTLGNDHDILSEFNGRGECVDLEGRAVIPGLIDAHIHLKEYALSFQMVNCETPTRVECLYNLAKRIKNTPDGTWILGHGWNQNDWPDGLGNAADLDQVAPHHPVYLTAKSLHAAWVNSLALQRAGIGPKSPDPPEGFIQRDEHGNPTGILFEKAQNLIKEVIPEPPPHQIEQALTNAFSYLWRMGLTCVHDFDDKSCFAALQSMHNRAELHLRVIKNIPQKDMLHAIDLGLQTGFGDNFLRVGGIKIFADGALGPQTAAMFQPYLGGTENRGMMLKDTGELFEHARNGVDNGFSIAIHAIGDRANHEVLNAFTQLRNYERERSSVIPPSGRRSYRHRIEHVQIIHPNDAKRVADLGILASMQPFHATSDMLMADRLWGERAATPYAWRTLLDQNVTLAFGSDAPVESPNPFWGLHSAVTRRRLDGTPGPDGWYPSQKLSLSEALHAYTGGAAYAAGMEDRLGKLAPGFLADMLILDADPFDCPLELLQEIQPLGTMIGGKWVFNELGL